MSEQDHTPIGRLDDEALDRLLSGHVPAGLEGTALPALLAALREDAAVTTPTPSPELAALLEAGPAPVLAGSFAANAGRTRRRSRVRRAVRVFVTKFAALGALAQAGIATAAVSVAVSGAGVVGVLPGPAQTAFDDVVDGWTQSAPDDVPGERGGVDGGAVSGDATGEDDGSPGLDDRPGADGADVAEERSGGRPTEQRPTEPGSRSSDAPAGQPTEPPAVQPSRPAAPDQSSEPPAVEPSRPVAPDQPSAPPAVQPSERDVPERDVPERPSRDTDAPSGRDR